LDASHFRQRAATARELAQAGDDRRLAKMLLELAIDLDAEAAAIEAEQASAEALRSHPAGTRVNGGDRTVARIIDLTSSSAKSPTEARPGRFSAVVLPFPGCSIPQETTPVPSGADHAAAARETLSLAVPAQPLSADKPADACTLLTMG
jgi:hypothetical protein